MLFLGSKEGLETQIIPAAGFKLFLIPKVKVPRKLTPALLLAPIQLLKAINESISALSGVNAAIGFGGYISAPLYIAAKIKKVPFLIHLAEFINWVTIRYENVILLSITRI